MRILHTSDLHLGRSLHGRSLFEDQETIHRELLAVCREEQVDAVLVSGDVYDQASPRTDVIDQFSRLLGDLNALGVQVVLSSGNHDSAARLGFGASVLETAGVHLRTRIADLARPVRLGTGRAGTTPPVEQEEADPEVLVYGIPYLDPRSAASVLGCAPTHAAVLGEATARIRADAAEHPSARVVVMAHCFAVGAEPTDSERVIDSGNLGAVPASIFEGFDYTALGHLHGRQRVCETVRYSGSPLRFSFSEAEQTKGYWLLETTAEGLTVRPRQWMHQVPMARLRGTLEELLSEDRYAWAEQALCQITLTDTERPAHPMERLRTRFPEAVELIFSELAPRDRSSYARRLARARTAEEVCDSFYDRVRGRGVEPAETELLADVVAEARGRERASDGVQGAAA